MAKVEDFKDPIEIPQFFFTRELYETMNYYLDTYEEIGEFFSLLSHYALFNIVDMDLAKKVSPKVAGCFNDCVRIMYSGINKYRWDYFNGSKGGRPKLHRDIPQI